MLAVIERLQSCLEYVFDGDTKTKLRLLLFNAPIKTFFHPERHRTRFERTYYPRG